MTQPVVRGAGRRAGGGLIPLLVAAVAVTAVAGWLLTGQPGGLYAGYSGGPVALVAAVVAAHRLGSTVKMASQLRAFWGQLSQAAILLLTGACVALAVANNRAGMSLYVAAPNLLGMIWAMLAFGRVPMGKHTPLGWVRGLLDGATVAVAGTLVFWYVVLSFAPPGTDVRTRDRGRRHRRGCPARPLRDRQGRAVPGRAGGLARPAHPGHHADRGDHHGGHADRRNRHRPAALLGARRAARLGRPDRRGAPPAGRPGRPAARRRRPGATRAARSGRCCRSSRRSPRPAW